MSLIGETLSAPAGAPKPEKVTPITKGKRRPKF